MDQNKYYKLDKWNTEKKFFWIVKNIVINKIENSKIIVDRPKKMVPLLQQKKNWMNMTKYLDW